MYDMDNKTHSQNHIQFPSHIFQISHIVDISENGK